MNNSIIVMLDDCDKVYNMSLYEYIEEQFRYAAPMLVCHVTEEEYEKMLKQIEKGCLNERLPRSSSNDIGYDKYRHFMVYDFRYHVISVADYNDYHKRGRYTLNREGLYYEEEAYQFPVDGRIYSTGFKVYTTESFEDVINHYKK